MSSYGSGLYNRTASADITAKGTIVVLDTKDRENVAATLAHADSPANYTVQTAQNNSGVLADWHNVSTQVQSTGFRFQGTVPERYVRIFENGTDTASGSDTGDFSIVAV